MGRMLLKMRNSPCLSSLDVETTSVHGWDFTRLQGALFSCKNLQDLSLILENGDEIGSVPADPAIALRLRSFELAGNELGVDQSFWSNFLEWSALERLSTTHLSFLPLVGPQLIGLRSLRVDMTYAFADRPILFSFLLSCQKLEELDLIGFMNYFSVQSTDRLWSHLGKTLKSIRLHEYEDPRSVLGHEEIGGIAEKCPKLCRFGLDLECSGTWVGKLAV